MSVLGTNIITEYNDMLYESRPVSFNEFITDKYNKVHHELYLDALSKFFKDLINKAISPLFVYWFYTLMEDKNWNFEQLWDAIEKLNADNPIRKAFKILSFDSKSFMNEIYELTSTTLNTVKNMIVESGISGIQQISDINDFRIMYIDNYVFLGPENDDEEFENEFVSYRIECESDTSNYSVIEERVYSSELNDYVFILENYTGTRIGYNSNGEWIVIFNNKAISEEEFEKMIHSFKYTKDTSRNLIEEYRKIALRHYKATHKIIEFKASEYWMPSSINIISNVRPYKKEVLSLEKYWNMTQRFGDVSIYDVKNTNENILDAELCDIDYIKGTAKIESRTTGIEYDVPFKYLSEDVNVSSEMTLDGGFIIKYNNL